MTKRALVTGATGQDGRLTSRLLLGKGYEVVGTSRRAVPGEHSAEGVPLLACTLTDTAEMRAIVADVRPHEIYNFAAFSTGSGMFDDPVAIGDVNGLGPVRILDAIRAVDPAIRFCQASSAEMFGARSPAPQSAATRLDPRSPYGAAKQFAHTMIDVYRGHHGVFACSAILFNHESELRPASFVTRKVTRAAARIAAGLEDNVTLGTLDVMRDWGYAGDTVAAMWLMLQQDQPGDYVVATGTRHSIRDLVELAFTAVGLDWRNHVRLDPGFVRPRADVELIGDPSALTALGWSPTMSFPDLVRRMVAADADDLRNDRED